MNQSDFFDKKPLTSDEVSYVERAFDHMMKVRTTELDVLSEGMGKIGYMVHHLAVVSGPAKIIDVLSGLIESIGDDGGKYLAMHDAMRMRADMVRTLEKL